MNYLRVIIIMGLALVLGTGCSHHDDAPLTPVMYDTTPTYRSTTRSTDIYVEPLYTQPGVNSGPRVQLPHIASQDRWDPNDPMATDVYNALTASKDVQPQFLRVYAHKGVIWLQGIVSSKAQSRRAAEIARGISGVRTIRNDLHVAV